MSWTGPEEIRSHVLRLWERGDILRARLCGDEMFPLRLRTSRPSARDLGEHFDEVRAWIRALEEGSKATRGHGYEIGWTEVVHRQLGKNRIPATVHIPSEADALALVGKRRDAELVVSLADVTRTQVPELEPWVRAHPLKLLEHGPEWARVLRVVAWFRAHPRPGVYLRQIDVPGVDTKFVERRRGLFIELLDAVLPEDAVERGATGSSSFERRYGLLSKPALVRFRVLDPRLRLRGLTDVSTPEADLGRLELPVRRVFVTENEINGLAFPDVPDSVVVFGLGYGVDRLSAAAWLAEKDVFYWGDIDTHGFAMLDRLRRSLGGVRSLLMDRETLLAHRDSWGSEPEPHEGTLPLLTVPERDLYDDLRLGRLGEHVRLEQEHVGFGWLLRALRGLG